MSLDLRPSLDVLESLAMQTAEFDRVNSHEPKRAPNSVSGLTLSIFLWSIGNAPGQSGQAQTTGLIVWNGRIMGNMLKEPQDEIDPALGFAAAKFMEVLSGDFELGGNVRCVDLLGMTGTSLSAQAGYVTIDHTMFRIMDVRIPLIINDIWDQAN